MAAKRRPGDDAGSSPKRAKNGFTIGPANLPDGTHKRKVQKIKKELIHKVKLKKEYARLKAREAEALTPRKSVYEREEEADGQGDMTAKAEPEPNLELHPDRLRMLGSAEREEPNQRPERRQRRPRPMPFGKEMELAQKKKEEGEARRATREEAAKERAQKLAERDRVRKKMAKARGGPTGQRKLGRESIVLLARAEKLMGRSGSGALGATRNFSSR